MNCNTFKSAWEENQICLAISSAFIISVAIGIALSGVGLFGLSETGFAFGVTGLTALLIPLSPFAILYAAFRIGIKNNDSWGAIVYGIFPSVAIVGGTILSGVSLLGKLDDNAKFIVGMVGFTLLISSLLCFIAHGVELIRNEYESQKRIINDILKDVDPEAIFKNEVNSKA